MRVCIMVVLGIALGLGSGVAAAETLHLEPLEVETFAVGDGSEEAAVGLRFDVSSLEGGAGRQIFQAFVIWPLEGLSSEMRSEYVAHVVSEQWSGAGVAQGVLPDWSEPPLVTWEIESLDYQRNDGGLLILDVTSLVGNWIDGTETNNGFVITSKDVGADSFESRASEARLVIRYGFLPHEE